MDDIDSLRHQYSRLRGRLDKQQGILNAYLQGKVPTGRGLDGRAASQTSQYRHEREQRNPLSEISQWSSTPLRQSSTNQKSGYDARQHTHTSKQRSEGPSHIKRVKSSEKRKSDLGTPRQVGRGSSLAHHGSESKRQRSMDTRHPRSHTKRTTSSSHHPHSSRKHSRERGLRNGGVGKRRVGFEASAARSHRTPTRREETSECLGQGVAPDPFLDDYEQESLRYDENPAEESYVEQLLSMGNDRLAANRSREVNPVVSMQVNPDRSLGVNQFMPEPTRAQEVTPKPRSILLTPGGRTKKTPARVSFLQRLNRGHQNSPIRPLPLSNQSSSVRSALSTSALQGSLHDRSVGNVTQPLLGYDWIAGVLDTADADTAEQSNAYLEDIKLFRQLNRDECIHTTAVVEEPDAMNISQSYQDEEDPRTKAQEHKCIHNYVLNNRLFAVPLHGANDGESLCAICQNRRSSKPTTATSPSYIRVSIPRSTLSSPYRVRPHRRQSFDPTDSMGLSQHCLAGWQNSRPSMMPPATSVDLRASLDKTMVAASSLYDTESNDSHMAAGRPLGPSRHTQGLLNRSHALRVDLQRLERAGLSMEASMGASRNYPLL